MYDGKKNYLYSLIYVLGGFTSRKPSDLWTLKFFLVFAKNSMRKLLSEVTISAFTNVHVFFYVFFLKCHFLSEIRKFVSLWIFAILLLFDVIQRNNFLGILKFLLLETENFTFDGCFLIKWIFRNSLIILEWF